MIRALINNRVVRYFFSAGTATGVDVLTYFITFNYIFMKMDITFFEQFVISAATLSLMISYSAGLVTNFIITKFIVFTNSDLRSIHQFMRYLLVAFLVLVMNYLLMSLLIKGLDWYPTIARLFSAISIGFMSYMIHKVYSFKGTSW